MSMKSSLMKRTGLFASIISSFSMVLGPQAQAAEVAENAKAVMEQTLKELQYYRGNKKQMTYNELWAQMKQYVPKEQKIKIDEWMVYHGNQAFPKIEAQEILMGNGQKNIRATFVMPEGRIDLTYLGDEKAFAKLGDKTVSRKDLLGLTGASNKLAKNSVMKKIVANQKKVTDQSMPKMSYEMWNAMKPAQRAEYMVWVRIMLQQAEVINNAQIEKLLKGGKGQKTSSVSDQIWQQYVKLMMGESAWAAEKKTKCIVAGHVTDFDLKRNSCNHDIEMGTCGSDKIACNKYIYGPSKCINRSDLEKASFHFSMNNSSGCDKESPLSSESSFSKLSKLECFYNRSCNKDDFQSAFSADTELNQNSEKLILEIAQSKGLDWNVEKLGNLSQQDFDHLNEAVFKPFNEYVENALLTCSDKPFQIGNNKDVASQVGACQGLYARKLAMEYKVNLLKDSILSPVEAKLISARPVVATEGKCDPKVAPFGNCSDAPPTAAEPAPAPPQAAAPAQEESGICQADWTKWCFFGAGVVVGYLLAKNKKKTVNVNCMPPLVQDGNGCKPVIICSKGVAADANGNCPGKCADGATPNAAGQCIGTTSCPTGSYMSNGNCLTYITCSDGSKVMNVSQCPVVCTYPLTRQGNSCVAPVTEGGSGSNPNNPGAGGTR